MKVNVKTVSDRITILENQKTRSLNEDFQLAVYRWALEQQQRAEAAEAECSRLDRESQNLSSQLGQCNRERLAALAKLAELEKQRNPDYFLNRIESSDKWGPEVELRIYESQLDASKSQDDHGGGIIDLLTRPEKTFSPPKSVEQSICDFVKEHYSQYQGSYLCGKCAEIVCYLLNMAGRPYEKMVCNIDGLGHVLVKSGNKFIDPSIKRFGDYPEFINGDYPINDVKLIAAHGRESIFPVTPGDCSAMAKELLALRKQRKDGVDLAAGVYTILGISGCSPTETGSAQQKLMKKAGDIIYKAKDDGISFDWYANWMD